MDARELRIGNWFKTNQEVFNPREQIASKIEAAGHINDYHESFCEPIPITEKWLLKFGFEEKPAYQWHGNGFDYQVPAKEGGSTTEFRDFVLYLKNDDSFIVRFTSYRWHVYNEDKSISFHLCEWHEKCDEEIICFDTSKVHCLQNAFHLSTGEELTLKTT